MFFLLYCSHYDWNIAGIRMTTIRRSNQNESFPFFSRVWSYLHQAALPKKSNYWKETPSSQTNIFRVHVSFPGICVWNPANVAQLNQHHKQFESIKRDVHHSTILYQTDYHCDITCLTVLKQRYLYNAPTTVRELLQILESVFITDSLLFFFETYFVGFGYCNALWVFIYIYICACCL